MHARINGFNVVLPNYVKIPYLMENFIHLLHQEEHTFHPVELAA